MNDHIITYTGIAFCPSQPKAEDISIDDICHALSLMCRANGHLQYFYSVGQHSVNCALEARARRYGKKVQIACLLHDASEAYLSDITRPVKSFLPEYLRMEDTLQKMIYEKFIDEPLTPEELLKIKEVDDDMLYNEYHFVMNITDKPIPRLFSSDMYRLQSPYQDIKERYFSIFYGITGYK